MGIKIDEVLKNKEKEIKDLEKEIQNLKELLVEFPDLEKNIDRWRNETLMSKQVNTIADNCWFKHDCGCCHDSPYYVLPYIERNGTKIYSNSQRINIGEKNPYPTVGKVYKSERAYDNWEESLKEKNISEVVIEKTRKHLEAVADLESPIYDDDVEDMM